MNWKVGDTIPRDQISHFITQPAFYGLPPLNPGERYVIVNGQILTVSDQAYKLVAVFQAVNNLFK